MPINEVFHKVSAKISNIVGTPWAFLTAIAIIAIWGLTGPVFGFSDTWQLVINTGTTIVTFLMVFLIQNTQNRDSKAIHLKLDELLKGSRGARNAMVNIEELPDDVLEGLQQQFRELHERHQKDIVNKDGKVKVTHEDKMVVKK